MSTDPSSVQAPSRVRPTPPRWFVTGTLALYVAYLLTRLAVTTRFPVFWDEGFHLATAQTGLVDPSQRFGAVADGKPPLFSWVTMVFLDAGVPGVAAIRLVSLLGGLVTLTAVLYLGRTLISHAGALVAGALYVLSPYMLVHDGLGLLDGPLTAAVTLALALQVRLARRPTPVTGLALGAVMGAAILTRQTGLLTIVLLPFSLVLLDWSAAGRRRRLLRWAGSAAAAVVLALVVAAVQKLAPYASIPTPRQNRPVGEALRDPFRNVDAVWTGFSSAMVGYVGVGVLLLALVGLVVALRRRDPGPLLLLLWALAPIALVFLLLRFGYPRYFVAAFPPVALLAAAGAVAAWRGIDRVVPAAARPAAAVLGGAVVLIPTTVLLATIAVSPDDAPYPGDDSYQLASGWPAGTGLDPIAARIRAEAPSGTSVLAATAYTPWNLGALLGSPVRSDYGPPGAVPYQNEGGVDLGDGRTVRMVNAASPVARDARFVLLFDEFGPPAEVDLDLFTEVYTFTRADGATFLGTPREPSVIRFYVRSR